MLSLLASLAVVIAATGAPDMSPLPEPQAPIRIVSATHEVDFPDEVVFRLEAEAASPITEVTLYYVLPSQETLVYAYPTFVPDTHVSADFRLRTSGASYIPSGTDIEYYYRIGDERGNTLVTQRFTLGYRDPAHKWQELHQGELVLLWHDCR